MFSMALEVPEEERRYTFLDQRLVQEENAALS